MASAAEEPSTTPEAAPPEHGSHVMESHAQPVVRPIAWGLSGADLLIIGLAALLCMAVLPPVMRPFWTPRAGILLMAVGPGLVMLILRARRKDRGAVIAIALVAWTFVCAWSSPSRLSALIGQFGTDHSALFVAGALACWGLGMHLSPRARQLLPPVLLVVLGISGLIGFLQVIGALHGLLAGRYDGRASGLTDSPVYFGPLMAGAAVLVIGLVPQLRRWWTALPAIAFFSMCVNLSGTRVALGALVIGGLLAARHVRGAARVAVIAALLSGLLIGTFVPGAVSAGSRLRDDVSTSAPVSGLTPRLEAWKAAGTAISDRPLVGYGPGQFSLATTRHLSLDFARAEGPDRIFIDAHNLVIEAAATLGIPGALLVALFALVLARRARGPLALFGFTVGITWMLEPVSQTTAPLVLLALGAASLSTRSVHLGSEPILLRAGPIVSSAIALLAAVALIVGDAAAYSATTERSLEKLAVAERWLPESAFLSDLRTVFLVESALVADDRTSREAALTSARRTVAMRDGRWIHWVRLGEAERAFGSDTAAVRGFREALERYPWSEAAWRGLAFIAVDLRDQPLLDEANGRLCLLGSTWCDQFTVEA